MFLIIKNIIKRVPEIVLQGGLTLTKVYKAADRYSDDVDFFFEELPSEEYQEYIKGTVLKELAYELNMEPAGLTGENPYNRFYFNFEPLPFEHKHDLFIKIEISNSSACIDKDRQVLGNSFYNVFNDDSEFIKDCGFEPFELSVCSLNKTFIDKLFAVPNVYMAGRTLKNSKHIFDAVSIAPFADVNEVIRLYPLKFEMERAKPPQMAPVYQPGVDIRGLVNELSDNDFFKEDYNKLIYEIADNPPSYEAAIEEYRKCMLKYLDIFENAYDNKES